MKKTLVRLAESAIVPDFLIKLGIRRLNRNRIKSESASLSANSGHKQESLIRELTESPIALVPESANEQHYEVPPALFRMTLGRNLKYSSCYWDEGTTTLDRAEDAMLRITVERAEIRDGFDILELGCGWGSLSIYMAERFPGSTITAVSNSKDQAEYIRALAEERNLINITVITEDMNNFNAGRQFDRIVSVEMFEHMRNYRELLKKIASWLKKDGKLFVHIFCHREFTYPFIANDESDWMAKYFFTGGLMPSEKLLYNFQDDLSISQTWKVNGAHYQKTARAWLQNLDRNKNKVIELFVRHYGKNQAALWFRRWRIFFLACEELFGYNNGNEWYVMHYLFSKR